VLCLLCGSLLFCSPLQAISPCSYRSPTITPLLDNISYRQTPMSPRFDLPCLPTYAPGCMGYRYRYQYGKHPLITVTFIKRLMRLCSPCSMKITAILLFRLLIFDSFSWLNVCNSAPKQACPFICFQSSLGQFQFQFHCHLSNVNGDLIMICEAHDQRQDVYANWCLACLASYFLFSISHSLLHLLSLFLTFCFCFCYCFCSCCCFWSLFIYISLPASVESSVLCI
jgi:hypothetical protein